MRRCDGCNRDELACDCEREAYMRELRAAKLCAECDDNAILANDIHIHCEKCGKGPLCRDCTETCDGEDCVAPICKRCSNDARIMQIKQQCRECWAVERKAVIRERLEGSVWATDEKGAA